MKKAITFCLFVALAMPFNSCNKTDPTEDPAPQQSKTDLISRTWILKESRLNGNVQYTNGTSPYYFAKNGDFKWGKDAQGKWKYEGKYAFADNETAIKIFLNEPNEMYWTIKSLTNTKMETEFTPSTTETFNFTLIAN